MAKHKTLQGVANSFADSFTSLMNYAGNDYVMGHILAASRETGSDTLEVDLISGHIEPEDLCREPIVQSIAYRCADLPNLIERSGSDPAFVTSARMTIAFDIATERPVAGAPHLQQSPFVCTVSVTDDRGKTYEAVRTDWWYPEEIQKVSSSFLPRDPTRGRRGPIGDCPQAANRQAPAGADRTPGFTPAASQPAQPDRPHPED
jgi:hypothetical protein